MSFVQDTIVYILKNPDGNHRVLNVNPAEEDPEDNNCSSCQELQKLLDQGYQIISQQRAGTIVWTTTSSGNYY